MYKKKSISRLKTILRSLKQGASVNAACQSAGIDVSSFWSWRKKDKRLDSRVKEIYDSRIAIVEDALYKLALEGNPTAQIFFLKNRAVDRWRDKQEIEHGGEPIKDRLIIIRDNANQAKGVAGQVCVQQGQTPSNGIVMGDRQDIVRNIAGNDILRADTKQPGDSIS